MNIDHGIGIVIGVALAAILVVPVCILVVWLVRGYRVSLEAEKAQAAELAELIGDLKIELEKLRGESNKWVKSSVGLESAKLHWKRQYDDLLQKHNALVRTHNDLVRRHNVILKDVKSQTNARTETDSQLQALALEAQDLRGRLDEALQRKQDLLKECQALREQIEALGSDRDDLQHKLATALQQLQVFTDNPARTTQDLGQPTHDVAALLAEINDLRRQIGDSGRCNDELTSQLNQFRKEMEIVARQNDEYQGFTADVKRENQELRLKTEALERKRQEAASQQEKLIQESQDREGEVKRIRSENADLTQKLEDLARHLELALAGLSAGYGENIQESKSGASGASNQLASTNCKLVVPRWQDTRPVVVGLDFGTYSTKVVVRVRGERKSRAIFIDESAANYPAFVVPSLVRLKEGRLYFGRRALLEGDGVLFRSLKVSLLPPTSRDGWSQGSFPIGTTPDLLVAFYLAWVLGRLKTILGQEGVPQVSLNLAAPMDHLENTAMKERYLHVVHAAWQATFGPYPIRVDQGAELSQYRPLFEFWLERTVPDLSVRKFEILPETLAPLVSLSQDPRVKPGFYMMVDMGAGTTELSVSLVSERDADHRILCYADKTIPLGGNQFNENDEKNAGTNLVVDEEERLKKQLLGTIGSIWYRGFAKDKDGGPTIKYKWKQLNLILSGGGLRRAGLQSAIERTPPMKAIFGDDPTEYDVKWHHPADLEFFASLDREVLAELSGSLPYLAVAHGLSLERQKWPEWRPPGDVETTSKDDRGDDPLDFGYLDW